MMFSGRVIGGEEAVAMGLANRCVAEEELLQEASRYGEELLGQFLVHFACR